MDSKPWYRSQTILSLIGAAISAFAPAYVDVIPPLVGKVLEVFFLGSATIGRFRARKRVTLRKQE